MQEQRIVCKGASMQEALGEVEHLGGLEHKQRNCLMLLTEEMFSMMNTILFDGDMTFEIVRQGSDYALGLRSDTLVTPKARKEFLSMSSDGKNIAYKGIKGKMLALIEAMANAEAIAPGLACGEYGMAPDPSGYSQMWRMSLYLGQAPEPEREAAWDGMEKSIIVNFADDVMIGVRENRVEMIVKKKF